MRNRLILLLALLAWTTGVSAQKLHTLPFKTVEERTAFFKYDPAKPVSILISGHRGENIKDFPENSIAAMEDVLKATPAMFEIDPRITKDSAIILMHDKTFERTTNGSGKVDTKTFAYAQSLQLIDRAKQPTPYKIPTLEEVMLWAKGKTLINLDRKGVPDQMIVDLIHKLDASLYVMLTVHKPEQALFYYKQNQTVMYSIFCKTMEEFKAWEATGIPWSNMIAYVGWTINEKNAEVVKALHAKGVKCMTSVAPTVDNYTQLEERIAAYQAEAAAGADIIESDLPIDLAKALSTIKTPGKGAVKSAGKKQ